jgi:hypothetical protein
LGRAPGTDPATAHALRRTLASDPDAFPQDLLELMGYFAPQEGASVRAVPGADDGTPSEFICDACLERGADSLRAYFQRMAGREGALEYWRQWAAGPIELPSIAAYRAALARATAGDRRRCGARTHVRDDLLVSGRHPPRAARIRVPRCSSSRGNAARSPHRKAERRGKASRPVAQPAHVTIEQEGLAVVGPQRLVDALTVEKAVVEDEITACS